MAPRASTNGRRPPARTSSVQTSSESPSSSSLGASKRSRSVGGDPLPPPSPADDPDDSNDSVLSDFERELKAEEQALRDAAELAEARTVAKECKKKGAPLPKEIKAILDDHKKGRKVPLRPDQHAVLALARDAIPASQSSRPEGSGRGETSLTSHGGARITKPTFDRGAKRREIAERTGLRAYVSEAEDEEEKGLSGAREIMQAAEYDDDPEEVRKHLSRRWVDRRNPELMPASRKRMEERYNPLIKLLDIKIKVASDDQDDSASRPTGRRASRLPSPKASESSEDSDWQSDGLGPYSSMFKLRARPSPKVKPEPPSAAGAREYLVLSDDDDKMSDSHDAEEGEPDTEEDELEDTKPRLFPPARETGARAAAHISLATIEIDDEFAEPDTEEDDEPASLPMGSAPSSQQLSQARSQPKGERRSPLSIRTASFLAPKSEPSTSSDECEDEVSRAIKAAQRREAKRQEALAAAKLRQEELLRSEQKARVEAERRAAVQAKLAELARSQRAALASGSQGSPDARASSSPCQDFDQINALEDSGEEDWRAVDPSLGRVQYPKPPVRKSRPHFPIQDAVQERTGPHQLCADETDSTQVPAPINRFLRRYQREGAQFLYEQYEANRGGILGDDMGLGKTIQVIAFLAAVMGLTGLRKDDKDRRARPLEDLRGGEDDVKPSSIGPTCLIVCPASVVYNWARELETWGYFAVGVYANGQKQKEQVLRKFARGQLDIVIAGFEAVRSNIDELARHDFSIIVADEAHKLKSPTSAITQAMHAFPTRRRYALTGTAIQNRLSELWCVLHWVVPGRVGTYAQWRDLVTRPIALSQQANASPETLAIGITRSNALAGLLLPEFLLRRTKASVRLELPAKTDHIVLCPLTALQKAAYERLLALDDVEIMIKADQPCKCGKLDDEGRPYRSGKCCHQDWSKLIFKYIVLFQKVANHLGLLYPDREDLASKPEKYKQDQEWMKAAFPDDWQNRRTTATALLDPELCGKWKILRELLAVWHRRGDKVLIFSGSLRILCFLEEFMSQTRYDYLVLDGSTPQESRMPLVDEFNDPGSEKFCFLISTKAGGVGLNLTAANRVVIFDPNWNPAHDLQAMDRAYRIGQKRPVEVYRLIGGGTLEELVYNRQQYKRALASVAYDANAESRLYDGVQDEGKALAGELFGVKNMFKLHGNISITEKSIFRADMEDIAFALKNNSALDLDADGAKPQPLDQHSLPAAGTSAADGTQDEIANILNGTIRVQSDVRLGGSKIETLRAQQAIQARQGRKPATSTASSASMAAKLKPKAKPTAAAAAAAMAQWEDVVARRKRPNSGSSTSSPAKKPKVEPKKEEEELGNAMASLHEDIPDHVSVAEIITCSGYYGARGSRELAARLEACTPAETRALVRQLKEKWWEAQKEGE